MSPNSHPLRSTLSIRRTTHFNPSLRSAAVLILGSSLLWTSAKVQVPFWPVPVTLQTYVVLTLGALFGWRLGAATVAVYLFEGAIGFPVFAGTPLKGIGFAYMVGPTGGYLAGYLLAAVLVGMLLNGRSKPSVLGTALALAVGELAILGLGGAWLAVQLGWKNALALGVGPFLVGDAVKLALAVATTVYVRPLIVADDGSSRAQ
jgi:biotin transport system substrate-specific component